MQRYYDFCHSTDRGGRLRFLDHGITSSLLLLCVWDCYKKQIEAINEFALKDIRISKIKNRIVDFTKSDKKLLKNREKTINAAASAIALHNIDMALWKEERDKEELLSKLAQ